MVAMRVCVKCWQSSASISAAANAKLDFFVSCLPSRYIAGSIRMPASAPITRQPNGTMPKIAMPRLMMTLPSGGWLVSYGAVPCRCSYAVRAW